MHGDQIPAFYAVVAQAIVEARGSHVPSLTQDQLAGRTDSLTRSAIANIESGRQRVALHQLVEIAEATGRALVDFLPDVSIHPTPMNHPDVARDPHAREFTNRVMKSRERLLQE
jgi:transcriptional regulator with XRE-family HTH domain